MKMVKVTWHDCVVRSGWRSHKSKAKLDKCVTVGFLVRDTSDDIVVASTVSGKQMNAVITIPRGWVEEVKDL